MAGTITIGSSTKYAHGQLISWLNALLNSYVSGFWDWSIKNMVDVTFIKENNTFMQELYQGDGVVYAGFFITGALNTTSPQILYFDLNGVPIAYNNADVNQLFEFDEDGFIERFYEGVAIPLYDSTGTPVYSLEITATDKYGIRVPMTIITRVSGGEVCRGFLDTPYDNKYSGTYSVQSTPLDTLDKFSLTNITNHAITIEIPILTNLFIKYDIGARQTQIIPATIWTDYFIRTGIDLTAFRVSLISSGFDPDVNPCDREDIFTINAVAGSTITDDRLMKRDVMYFIVNDTDFKNIGYSKPYYSDTATFNDGLVFIGGETVTVVLNH